MIIIDSSQQILKFYNKIYLVSTAKNGLGDKENSFCTPIGKHKIISKIGNNMPKNMLFINRKATSIYVGKNNNDDLILSRILWLNGIEEHNFNNKNRYIYIHGTNDEKNIGKAVSKGCIRMKNNDILELFNLVNIGDIVLIK